MERAEEWTGDGEVKSPAVAAPAKIRSDREQQNWRRVSSRCLFYLLMMDNRRACSYAEGGDPVKWKADDEERECEWRIRSLGKGNRDVSQSTYNCLRHWQSQDRQRGNRAQLQVAVHICSWGWGVPICWIFALTTAQGNGVGGGSLKKEIGGRVGKKIDSRHRRIRILLRATWGARLI